MPEAKDLRGPPIPRSMQAFQSWRNRFRDAYVAEAESFINSILDYTEPERLKVALNP